MTDQLPWVVVELDRLQHEVVREAVQRASVEHYIRRADELAAVGTARCTAMAQACRNRALLVHAEQHHDGDVLAALREGFSVTCPTCQTPTSPWTCSCGQTRIGGRAA